MKKFSMAAIVAAITMSSMVAGAANITQTSTNALQADVLARTAFYKVIWNAIHDVCNTDIPAIIAESNSQTTNVTVTGTLSGAALGITGTATVNVGVVTTTLTGRDLVGTNSVVSQATMSSPVFTCNTLTSTNTSTFGAIKNNGGGTNTGVFKVSGILYADGGEQVTGTLNTDLIGGTTANLVTIPQSQLVVSNNATVGSLTSAATRVTGTLTTKDAAVTNQLDALTGYVTNLTVYTGVTVPAGSVAVASLASGLLPANVTVSTTNINDLTIVNGDISATAAIDVTKLGTGKVIPANSGASLTNLNFAAGNLTGGCGVINDTTNRFYYEATGVFGTTGAATGTLPFVASVKPIVVNFSMIGDASVGRAEYTNAVYSYATSDITNLLFFGPAAEQFGWAVWLKKP